MKERSTSFNPALAAPYDGNGKQYASSAEMYDEFGPELSQPEVTSVDRTAALIEFAGTKEGKAEIEKELVRRAAEGNDKIRSVVGEPGMSRKQRREIQRRQDKMLRKAKAAATPVRHTPVSREHIVNAAIEVKEKCGVEVARKIIKEFAPKLTDIDEQHYAAFLLKCAQHLGEDNA